MKPSKRNSKARDVSITCLYGIRTYDDKAVVQALNLNNLIFPRSRLVIAANLLVITCSISDTYSYKRIPLLFVVRLLVANANSIVVLQKCALRQMS